MSRRSLLKYLSLAALWLFTSISPAWGQGAVGFLAGDLFGYDSDNPTSLQFGPDGRLYIATQGGHLSALTVGRVGPGTYEVVAEEAIDLVRTIPNHNDNGSFHPVVERQVTGLFVTGTPAHPVLYVTSSDYRIGGKGGATDTNLDTNSGILSRLTLTAPGQWVKVDLVRGLPRSEENHSPNGMQLDPATNTLYIAQGGNTNAGAPSNNFAFFGETALAAAILSVDLDVIEAMPIQGTGTPHPWIYDLPTLDDPTRSNLPNGSDPGDPFGGNDGLNQAKLVSGGPVQVYAPGFRNPYDVLITESGLMYTVDNGANPGWGGTPSWGNPADPATATNAYNPSEPGSSAPDANGEQVNNMDYLHHVTGLGYYGGHPNPLRANPAGAGWYTFGTSGVWRTSTDPSNPFPLPVDWPPVPLSMANPVEGDFQSANNPNALWGWPNSTNGLAEYTASNFGGAMTGNLLTTVFNGTLQRIILNGDGTDALNSLSLASNFGNLPLDVTTHGDDDPFPGTIWVACYGSNKIVVFEPTDYDGGTGVPCAGFNDPALDEDGDGYSNADEIANGTDPCNPADTPPDFDGDFLSDLWDADDDGDGISDLLDLFQRDYSNGAFHHVPLELELLNGEPGYGFGGVGFTGWMSDYATDYLDLYDDNQLIVGGASGIFTISGIDHGDAWLSQNDQKNAFQFGLNIDAQTGPFYVVTRLMATNLFQPNPQNYQSAGLYIGNGDQDNYLRISAAGNGGSGGIEVYYERDAEEQHHEMQTVPEVLTASEYVDLYLSVSPHTGVVLPSFSIDNGPLQPLSAVAVEEPILGLLRNPPDSGGSHSLAVGIFATSNPRALGTPLEDTQFTANWDFIYALHHDDVIAHEWDLLATTNVCEARHETGLTAAHGGLILVGGRGLKPTEHLDLDTQTWSQGAVPPVELHHIQPVAYEGLVYVVGALTGAYPNEQPIERIYIYDPVNAAWHEGPMIPADRRRGAGGAVVYNGKIYLAGGSTLGHGRGVANTVSWFDVYDPLTNTWTALPDAPHARDHTQLVEAGGKLYLVGGRIGGLPGGNPPAFFAATVPEIDVYDPITNTWSTLPSGENLPTPRGGVAAARLGQRVIVAGGETGQASAHNEVEAYHTDQRVWETLPSLVQGRHSAGMVSVGDALYIVAGSGNRGGTPQLNSVEVFSGAAEPVNTIASVIPGTLELSVGAIDFGSLPSGSNQNQSVTLSNMGGNQGIVITGIAVSGAGSFTLDQPYPLPFVLAPNHEIDFTVGFNATGSSGTKSASLIVTSGSATPLSIPIEGVVTGGSSPSNAVRINAGGPAYVDSQGATWLADAYFSGGTPFTGSGSLAIAATDDPALYRTERWGNSSLSYQIPLEAGSYDVHLHMAEIYWGVQNGVGQTHTGARVFSVLLEGMELLSDYDLWSDVGPATAVVHSFNDIEVTDGVLNIEVTVAANNAKFSALEIIPAEPPAVGVLEVDAETIAFGSVFVGDGESLPLTLSNSGEAPLMLSGGSLSGADASSFSFETLTGTVLQPGESTAVTVSYNPESEGDHTAVLSINHDGANGPLAITLNGSAEIFVSPSPAVRINAGGPSYTDTLGQTWMADAYHAGGNAYATAPGLAIAGTDDPVLYRTERWGTNILNYQIPLDPGTYDVHLHFVEAYWGVTRDINQDNTGKRVFSVLFEGNTVLSDYDIWAEVGSATAVVESFTQVEVLDGALSITVDVGANHAKFSALEIVPVGVPPMLGELEADTPSVAFGTVELASTAIQSITLTNSGEAAVVIQNLSLEGLGANAFAIGTLSASTLEPNQSTALDLSFLPESEGLKEATLVIDHSGANGSLNIALSGTGESPPPGEGILEADLLTIAFGLQTTGTSTTEILTLANTGTAPLTLSQISVSGSDAAAFDHDFADETILSVGESLAVEVLFTPSAEGTFAAELEIFHDGLGGSLSIPLSGSAEDPVPPVDPIRINAGGPAYLDSLGRSWSADTYFVGGNPYSTAANLPVGGTDDPVLYRTERWGTDSLAYAIPLDPGSYDVHVHLVEAYWGVTRDIGQDNTGRRVFSLFFEGTEVLANYDIWADVGSGTAVVQSFSGVQVDDGTLNISVNVSANHAKFSAIEIVPTAP